MQKQTYMVQVTLGQYFEDLYVKATGWGDAIEAAKALVASDDSLKLFRHHFANYIA